MDLFGGKDWNVIAVTFERADLYRINGNRGKGKAAVTIRDNVRRHNRTLYWAVYNRKGQLLESGPGAGQSLIPARIMQRLTEEIPKNENLLAVLDVLNKGGEKGAKVLTWDGYPSEESKPAVVRKVWKLVVPGEAGAEFEADVRLVQEGDNVSGYLISSDGQEFELRAPRVENRRLYFDVTLDNGGEPLKLKFKGKMLNDVITGELVES